MHTHATFGLSRLGRAMRIPMASGSFVRAVRCSRPVVLLTLTMIALIAAGLPTTASAASVATIETNGYFTAVACPSATQCTAVTVSGHAVTFNPAAPTTPTTLLVGDGAALQAIACPSTTQCTVMDGDGHEMTFNPNAVGSPTVVTIDSGGDMMAIACPSTTQCTAVSQVGGDGQTSANEVTFNPNSPGSPTPVIIDTISGAGYVISVACASATQCTAVDLGGHEATFNPETITPGSTTPVLVHSAHLNGIACPSTTQCTAVDGDGQEEITFNPNSPGTPTPVNTPGFDQNSVACTSTSQCTIAGAGNNGGQFTFNPNAPGTPTPVDFAGTAGLASVSCPSIDQCTGVNDIGQEVTFNPALPVSLAVSLSGAGGGSVTAAGGISCPGTCTESYAGGSMVTLTAVPAKGSSFTGWSGAGCSGTGTCTVSMSQNQTVTATFAVLPPVAPTPITVKPVSVKLTIGSVTVKGAKLEVSVACHGTTGHSCTGELTLSTIEHLLGRKVIGVSARSTNSKPRRTTRAESLGKAGYGVAVGSSKTLTLSINATGRQLLTRYHKLPAKLTAVATGAKVAAATKTITIKATKTRHKLRAV
jgi:Divergent InlB B-repeat domain